MPPRVAVSTLAISMALAQVSPPNPADVASPDAIVAAANALISGPAGKPRDWNRFRSLCRPDAHFTMMVLGDKGAASPSTYDLTGFVAGFTQFLGDNAFFENDAFRRVDGFGHVAHVLSIYESRRDPKDKKPFARGMNSFQLVNDGKRGWIVNLLWEDESLSHPIPAKYLVHAPAPAHRARAAHP